MPETIKCPNCAGPVEPDPRQPTVACSFCKHHFKNPVFRPPRSKPPVRSASRSSAGKPSHALWLLVLIPVVVLLIGGIVSFVVWRTTTSIVNATTNTLQSVSHPLLEKTASPPTPDQALEQKLDSYIACMERAYPRAAQSMARYLSWVHSETDGPTCKERYVSWGLYTMYDDAVPGCRQRIEQAGGKSPALPKLHNAAQAFVNAATKVQPVMAQAEDYYSKKMYTVDDCAKGKRLHPELTAAFGEMTAAYQSMRKQIAAAGQGVLDKCLERTATSPTQIAGHNWANVLKLGGEMMAALRMEAAQKTPDTEVIKKHIAILNEAAAALEALSDQQKQAAGYDWTDTKTINAFLEGAVAFLNSGGGKALNRSSRFAMRTAKGRAAVNGTYEKLVVLYNEVIEDYADNAFCGSLIPCTETECFDESSQGSQTL